MLPATGPERFSVQDLGSALRFGARYRTQWVTTLLLALQILFILLVLAMLAWAEWTLFRAMGSGALLLLLPVVLFALVVTAVLLFVLACQLVELLWQVAGREELEIDRASIQLRHVVPGWATSRRYAADAVGAVFVSPTSEPNPVVAWFAPGTVLSRRMRGPSAFQSFTRGRVAVGIAASAPPLVGARRGSDADTAHFGSVLENHEAGWIVAVIHQRFPGYGPRARGPD